MIKEMRRAEMADVRITQDWRNDLAI